jgi:hypothetical protein
MEIPDLRLREFLASRSGADLFCQFGGSQVIADRRVLGINGTSDDPFSGKVRPLTRTYGQFIKFLMRKANFLLNICKFESKQSLNSNNQS